MVLWGYQRYVGLRSGSVALITQSVDSRNHIIIAISVTAGLVASFVRFSLVDTLVGLAVAIVILRASLELGVEIIRSLGEREADLSRYRIGLAERYEQFQQAQFRDWMLYLVEKEKTQTLAELKARALQALDFSNNPALRESGLDGHREAREKKVEQSLRELFQHKWLLEDGLLTVTDAGKMHLNQFMRKTRGKRHRLSVRE
jgi:hypothetical protein